jgi:hypothetical protein
LPALEHVRTSFLAEGRPGHGEAAPGDHLQTLYELWLPGHQLERGAAPWRDPYSFQPEASPRTNFAGWPFGLAFWPLGATFGLVSGWNAFVLMTFAATGGLTALWLRALGRSREAALAGGLAFALAPYLVAQGASGHLLAAVSTLLPLALWAWETRRPWLAAAALASVPLSGQLHLALGAVPFFLLYTWARPYAGRLAAWLAAAAAAAAGLVVWLVAVRGTIGTGRSFAQVERYSAEPADLISRSARHGLESYVFLGWLTPLLAVAGLAALVVGGRRRLALAFGAGAVVPIALSLGSHLLGYEQLWHLPGLHSTRVPERLMPVACLCLAGLAATALDAGRHALVPLVAVVLIAVDLRAGAVRFHATAADQDNRAYAALRSQPAGRLVEYPVYLPDRQEGSVYLYYAMQAPRERPAGYSTTAPRSADVTLRRLRKLTCSREPGLNRLLRDLGVRYVVLHSALPGCLADRFGDRRPLGSSDRIVVYALR